MFIICLLITIVLFGLAFIGTIGLFLHLSQKPKNISNKSFHFLYLVAIFLISFLIRLACLCTIANYQFTGDSFIEGMYYAINVLYVTGGGLTFEGQDAMELYALGMNLIAVIAYYGSILWLASTYIFIISLGLNYELSSRARLFFHRKKAKYIYIFTSITEDSLVLAESIEKHHKETDKEEPLIIFAGSDLPPYEKENELHRIAMANGYIYQSFYKAKEKELEKPLVVQLGIASKKEPFESLTKKRVRIFALENDSKEYGLESKNSDAVFDDIDSLIRIEFFDGKEQREIKEEEIIAFIQKHVDIKKERLMLERNLSKDKSSEINIEDPELLYIDYYLLSNSTINFEFYDNVILDKIRDIISPDLLKKFVVIKNNKAILKDKLDKGEEILSLYTYFKSIFQIHVVNESYLAGEDLISKRHAVELKNIEDDLAVADDSKGFRYKKFAINRVKIFHEEGESPVPVIPESVVVPDYVKQIDVSNLTDKEREALLAKDKEYISRIEKNEEEKMFTTLFLGFGQTGQMALNNLFVDSVSVEPSLPEKGINLDRYVPSRFISYIYDLELKQNIGVFTQTHPSYLVKKINKDRKDSINHPFFNADELLEFYGKDYPGYFEEIDELTKFPFIYGFEKNCKDLDFLEAIDGGTGNLKETTPGKNFGKINAIVIALGKDEENIKVANAILHNIRQELYNSDFSGKYYFYQTIFVNIRDEKNVKRLNWHSGIEAKRHPGVSVVAFGNREDMYSYDSIIADEKYLEINNIYDVISGYFDKIDPDYKLSGKEKNERILDPSIRESMKQEIKYKNKDTLDSRKRFLRISQYKKSSNKNSARFSTYTQKYIHTLGFDLLDTYEGGKLWKYLAQLEHNRWSRYNMSMGYIYSQTFVSNMKAHKDKYDVYGEFGYDDPKEYSKSLLKLHKCLLPFSYPGMNYLDDSTECYDYGNVIFTAVASENNKK